MHCKVKHVYLTQFISIVFEPYVQGSYQSHEGDKLKIIKKCFQISILDSQKGLIHIYPLIHISMCFTVYLTITKFRCYVL